jgi:peroxiredoxin Q/BCP
MGMYAARHTVYIGADGKILLVDREVNPKTAGQDLVMHLEAIGISRTSK